MDRFIVLEYHEYRQFLETLKSNMDRFIDFENTEDLNIHLYFKIQYG